MSGVPLQDNRHTANNPTFADFENCVRYGKYFYPAVAHYYPGSIVQCDKCLRTNLRASIGYQDIDLCLSCAMHVEMNMQYQNPAPIQLMSRRQI